MKNLKRVLSVFAALAMMLVMSSSQAITYSFTQVENDGWNIESQLSVEVLDTVDGVTFTFNNNVGTISSVTDIYFDQGATDWFSGFTIINQIGTDFSPLTFDTTTASPANLPGWSGIGFSADYSVDSGGNPTNGLDNSGDYITFLATAGTGFTSYWDLINDSDFRMGVKVQAYADGASDSYVTVNPIPVPAAAWLFGTALFGFFAASRRKKIS